MTIDLYKNFSACKSVEEFTALKEEINAVQELWEKDRKTYLVKKEYLETINYMCHDLRHEIRQIRKNGFVEEKMLRIESAIDKYDNVYHTGNPVLDIVMTEAAQYCEDNDIQFYCFTDTVEFGKLSEDILYSLFFAAIQRKQDSLP